MKDPLYYRTDLLATKGQRLANLIIDFIFRFVLIFAFGMLAGLLTAVGYDGLYIWIQNPGTWSEYLIEWGLLVVYYLLMEMTTQRTIGKLITGTKVVMEDGSKPPAGTIALRTLCRLIPFDAFSFLGDRGWHDSITHTYVVDVKKYNAAKHLEDSFAEIGSEIKYQ
ncbi:RDD family protein [Flavobacterium album]|uniref:RDD family protein n=1 Tax=Flavobacterium album TaxID=2175091 RepID=A0A2S1QWB6_9FLAO|nr:RDD family protein [Flavobacterium album]AWH84696.1 RDD family protein [Flavobacterium album]